MAAADDLQEIADYLYLHHPSFAAPTIQRLYEAVKSLRKFPLLGREGRIGGTRELVLAPLPYVAVYAVGEESVQILRFLHTSQERQ
jgi:plasmid stabilization system protein ParE